MFEVKNLSSAWKTTASEVFSNVTFALPQGKLTALCGVNGCGKSTLLSVMAGIPPVDLKVEGTVTVGSDQILNQKAKDRAKNVAFLVQNETHAWEITGRRLVENGRFVHQKWYENTTEKDSQIVDKVIAQLALTDLQNRPISNLSGGELQRFRIARALAQETPYILLDEPLAGLDLNYQKELMQLLQQLCAQGKTICISIHDVNMAATYAHQMILMKKDRKGIFQGPPEEMFTPEVIEQTFGEGFKIFTHPVTGKVQII